MTVGQLNQIYGMPKVESSPTSPIQLLQSSLADSAFSCLPSSHGSSLSLSFEVCLSSSRFIPGYGWVSPTTCVIQSQIFQLLINTLLFLSLPFHCSISLSLSLSLLSLSLSSLSLSLSLSSLSLFLSLCLSLSLCAYGCAACVKRQSDWGRPQMPALDLEHWYRGLMAAGDANHLCPPPALPAKAFSSRKPAQVTARSSALFHPPLLFHIFTPHLHWPLLY